VPAILATLKGQIALFQGDFASAVTLLEQALAQLPGKSAGFRGFVVQHLAMAHWITGNNATADTVLQDFQDAAEAEQSSLITVMNQAERHNLRGQITQSAPLYERALQLSLSEKAPGRMQHAAAHAELSLIWYEWNNLDNAEQHARAAVELGVTGMSMRAAAMGHFGLTRVLCAKGDVDGAQAALEQLNAITQQVDFGGTLSLDALHVPILLAAGDTATLRQVLQPYVSMPAPVAPPLHPRLMYYVAQGLLALNQTERAAQWVEFALSHNDAAAGSLFTSVPGHALLAMVRQAQGLTGQAHTELQQALQAAEPERFIRTFVDLGQPMAHLLAEYRAGMPHDAALPSRQYVDSLLAAFGAPAEIPAPPPETPQPLVEPLTDREIEVLQLIAQGYANKEIADELVISPGTVKVHTSHIYGKLSVNSRTQAVAEARKLGIIPLKSG
ncbi:MAG: hypothetical protein D6768_02125, partial [Chloroflexi bacterium]